VVAREDTLGIIGLEHGWLAKSMRTPPTSPKHSTIGEADGCNGHCHPPRVSEKGVDATVVTASNGVQALPETTECFVQFSPILVEREIEAVVATTEMSINATPSLVDIDISAMPVMFEASVDARPSTVSRAVGVLVSTASKCVGAAMEPLTFAEGSQNGESSSTSRICLLSFNPWCRLLPVPRGARIHLLHHPPHPIFIIVKSIRPE